MSDLKSKPILWTFHKLQDFCCCTANNLVFFSTQEALDTEYSMSCRNLFWKIKKWPSSSTASGTHTGSFTRWFQRTTRNQTLFNLNLKPADLLPSKQRNKHITSSHPLTQIYVPLWTCRDSKKPQPGRDACRDVGAKAMRGVVLSLDRW